MIKKHEQKRVSLKGTEFESKGFALLGMLPLIGYIIVMFIRKDNKYVVFYGKQGLGVFLAWVVAMVIGMILAMAPLIGQVLQIAVLVLWAIGLVNALSGEMKETPLIGPLVEKI